MVDYLAGDEVYVKHIGSVVDVGHAEVDFQDGVLAEEELALGIDVEAVVHRQTALVQVGEDHAQLAIGGGVVEIYAVLEGEVFIEALHLGERESRTEVPTATELPLTQIAGSVSQDDVDVVTTVEMGLVGHQ